MTAEEDYPRLLKACRIVGTLLLLISGLYALWMLLKISTFTAIFESMVEGGASSMPRLTVFLINFQYQLMGLMAFVLLASIWGVWMARRLPTLIYLSGGLFVFFTVMGATVNFAMMQPLITVIKKFGE